MGRAQSDTYSSMFNKSDNVKVVETFDKKKRCLCTDKVRRDEMGC